MSITFSDDHLLGKPGPAYFFQHLIWGYAITGTLLAAVRVDLFTALAAGPASPAEVAARCRTHSLSTEKLLVACAAMGLLEKDGDLYHNTPFADRHLVWGRPAYQGELVEHLGRQWTRWCEIDRFVRTGERGPQELAEGEMMTYLEYQEDHRVWILAMHNIAMGGQAEALADALDLSGRRLLCDVGGGPGTYALVLCQRYPQLQAVVLDLPETEPIAKEIIASFNLADRVGFRAADYLRDYGQGYDVMLLSGVLHGETPADCRVMLRKAYDSLAPGGLAVVQETLLNDEKTGPLLPALFSLHMTYGASYAGGEIAGWMAEVGFTDVEVRPLKGYAWLNGVVVGTKR
jgi:hypothetical protein